MRIIARLDVKSGRLVKTINLEGLRSLGECTSFAKKYMQQNIDEIMIIDPVASLYKRPPLFDIIDKVTNDVFVPITVSGGISSVEDALQLLNSGADKICLNTAAHNEPSLISNVVDLCGSQSIAISVQANKIDNKWFCYTNSGRDRLEALVQEWIPKVIDLGAGEIVLTSIRNEGMEKGLDEELLTTVKGCCNVPLVYSGGFRSLDDLNILISSDIRLEGIAISGALHYDYVTVSDIRHKLNSLGLNTRKL